MQTLNELAQAYLANPSPITEDPFAVDLLDFCGRTVNKYFRSARKFKYFEDCVPESFIKIRKYMNSFDSNKSEFTTWATMIIRQVCIDAVDTHVRHKELELSSASDIEATHKVSLIDKIDLKKRIAKLDQGDRDLIFMFLEGYNEIEMAKLTCISQSSLHRRLQTIFKKMQN